MNVQRQGRIFEGGGGVAAGGEHSFQPLLSNHHITSHHQHHQHQKQPQQQPKEHQQQQKPQQEQQQHSVYNNSRHVPGDDDPLQNPRPPESQTDPTKSPALPRHQREENFVYRAKRWSARLSGRASVLWNGWDDSAPPPPVPRHRTAVATGSGGKYNQSTSDANHIRLFESKSRTYTCRELLCIVFLPCLLVSLLGIALSSLLIYHHIGKEYEHEMESLEQELALTREKEGVYLTSHKYQELLTAAHSQKLAGVHEKDAMEELGSLLKSKTLAMEELTRKVETLRDTLDCTYTVIQTGGPSLMQHLDTKCKLSQRAQLLLAVSDQAAAVSSSDSSAATTAAHKIRHHHKLSSHHHQNKEGVGDSSQHWLLGAKRGEKTESGEFQQFLVTELTRMEQNIMDFAAQHEVFCSEFRLSMEGEVERRSQDLTTLAGRLANLVENQAKAIGKLEGLASDQMYAEQKWVTTYLKNTRNEADRQSTSLQGFLTESFLPGVRGISSGIRDISGSLASMHSSLSKSLQSSSSLLMAFLDSQKKLVLSTKDTVINLSQMQKTEFQALAGRQEELQKAEEKFGTRFREAKKKIDGLLASILAEYDQYSSVFNKSCESTAQSLSSLSTRSQLIESTINIAATQAAKDNDDFRGKNAEQSLKLTSEVAEQLESALSHTKGLTTGVSTLELQTKQAVGERQGAWEAHYANSEIMLRKKSDKNKELLQKHQLQTQDTHAALRQFTNELEVLSDRQRQADVTHTAERQADLQSQCRSLTGFTELLAGELHARDSDLANYFANSGRN